MCVYVHVHLCMERDGLLIIQKYLLSAYSVPGIIFQLGKLRLRVYQFTLFEISKTKTRIQEICF